MSGDARMVPKIVRNKILYDGPLIRRASGVELKLKKNPHKAK